ncbi:MAG: 2-dehydropantoate 2-reductase [Pseudomonadota bacterium]
MHWKWHVLGAGAMGCLWACRLAGHGWPVRLVLRNEHRVADYRRGDGLMLESGPEERCFPVPADSVAANGAIDALLLATKAGDAVPALESVAHRLHSASVIVLLQNGVAAQEAVHRRYGADRILCLSTSHGAWMRAPFHVVHAGAGQAWLGSLDPEPEGSGSGLRQRVLPQLPAGPMRIHAEPDMRARLWRKFAVNCAVNALTVLHDCRNGELLTRPAAAADLTALCEEIEGVLGALPWAPRIGPLWPQVRAVLDASADNVSSTLQDVRAGRRTELGWLNGWLIALAREQGLDCPRNHSIASRLSTPVPRLTDAVHAPHHQ